MGDSDDDYDRRRRDKFRRERSDYGREDRRGRDWARDRGPRDFSNRGGYVDRRRERFSPPRGDTNISPPPKRMRRDWDDVGAGPVGVAGGGYYEGGGGYGNYQHTWSGQPEYQQRPQREMGDSSQIPLMSFKQFVLAQEDDVDDEIAVQRYKDYKIEHRRQQLSEFFVAHKDEEWFKVKYHPEDSTRRQEEVFAGVRNRLQAFMYLLETKWLESIMLDIDKPDDIIRLLDAAVIKMEGGTDTDLKILDMESEDEEEGEKASEESSSSEEEEEEDEEEKKKKGSTGHPEEPAKKMEMDMTSKERELQKKAKEFLKKKQEKTEGDYKYDDDEDSGAEVDPAEQPAPPGIEAGTSAPAAEKEEGEGDDDSQDASSEKAKKEEKNKEMKESEEGQENGDAEEGEEKEETVAPVVPLKSTKPRPLHKTLSIFLRNLAPSITKQEVEAMCKRFPGYIRVALSEPQPERKFFRRGWVTFSRDVNIKEICWNLNNIRLRDCEMGPIVNRDLQRRIRPVNGIAAHKQVMKNDISLAARVVCNLDRQRHLWLDPAAEKKEKTKLKFGVDSRNPLLKNITDYFIDEMSAEEEELIGKAEEAEKSESTIDRDNTLCQVLDKMILYLRIVHSLDFYNASDYPLEDEMPNRCGIMHCRGPTPINPVSQEDVTEFVKTFSEKIEPFLQVDEKLTEDDAISLGKKDPEAEVEKFILANTQELAKDKWLCPLSGKKFKGPDFIRKHLMNKHCEKLDEVRAEVAYFNNYLLDLRRPVAQDQTKMMAQPPMGIPYPQAPQPAASYHPRPQPSYGGYAGGGGGYRGGYNQGADAGFSRGGGREYHNRSGRGRGGYFQQS